MAAVGSLQSAQFSTASPEEQTQANQASESNAANSIGQMPLKMVQKGIDVAANVLTDGASGVAEGAMSSAGGAAAGAGGAAAGGAAAGGAAAGGEASNLLLGLI